MLRCTGLVAGLPVCEHLPASGACFIDLTAETENGTAGHARIDKRLLVLH